MTNDQKNHLIEKITLATINAFSELRKKHPLKEFIAFALYSDESAMTVLPSANTKSHLQKMQAEDSDDPLYYKFSTAEWEFEYIGAEYFDDICEYLRNEHESIDGDAEFELFQNEVFEICVEVLSKLKHERFFTSELLVFSVSDYRDTPREVNWIKKLNSKNDALEFKKWLSEQ